MNTSPNQKFRPYFTISELQEISLALKQSPTPLRLALIKYIEGYIFKCTNGLISPQLTLEPTLMQKLELEESSMPQTKEKLGEAAYQKQLINPRGCSPKEISLALDYRYTHGLMGKAEEYQYEQSQGVGAL